MSRRIRNWRSALHAVVAARQKSPFAYGTNDCCMFAADCVRAITGEDPAAAYRGKYDSEKTAMRCCNGGSLAALVGTALGAEVGPREAQVGDVALVRQRGREALAVCVGGHLLAPGEKKLEYLPLSSIERVWRCARD